MNDNYDELVDRIMNMRRFGKKKGVEVSGMLLDALERPERGMKVIHVAGTNGKGSSCVFMAHMLSHMGYKVGLFTSPHLVDFSERIQVVTGNTFAMISHKEVVALGNEILDVAADTVVEDGINLIDMLTMFDICFVMALLKFRREDCDYVILETGLGGIYDSTTAISVIPKVCLITSIGLDHTKYLGSTITEIAENKAGIFVEGTKVVLSELDKSAYRVMIDRCKSLGIGDIYNIDDYNYDSYTYLKMLKGYQVTNAKAAIVAVKALLDADRDSFITAYMDYCHSSKEHCSNDCAKCADYEKSCELGFDEWVDLCVNSGIYAFSWPGRLEMISDNIIMDGAHNEEAFIALKEYLVGEYTDYEVNIIIGVLSDKDVTRELDIISPIADVIMTADITDDRGLSGEELRDKLIARGQKAKYLGDESAVAEYIYNLMQKSNANSSSKLYNKLYVVTGSLYFVGNVKRILWQLQQE